MGASFRIVSTLGPASATRAFLETCARHGQAHFRVNGSHVGAEDVRAFAGLAAATLGDAGFSLCLDLQGDKRRIGDLPQPMQLARGDEVSLSASGSPLPRGEDAGVRGVRHIPIPHPDLLAAASPGDALILADGAVRLEVTVVVPGVVHAVVAQGGALRSRAGVHVRGKSLGDGGLSRTAREQVELAAALRLGALALSFARDAAQIETLRSVCDALGYRPRIVAKLERPEALDRIEELARSADELWLCRGDLGTQVPLRELGRHQDDVLARGARTSTPVLVAGQVFHHLTEHDAPTRAEVVALHDLVVRGAAGIVLSDETAIGRDPVAAIETITALL